MGAELSVFSWVRNCRVLAGCGIVGFQLGAELSSAELSVAELSGAELSDAELSVAEL